MTWLLFGAAGQLGRAFSELISKTEIELRAFSREELDITDHDAVEALIAKTRPEWVLNAAAYNAVDRAESEQDLAQRINGLAPGWIAGSCERHGAKMLHLSTDFVFGGGGQPPYSETDTPAPLSAYGRSKLAGETAVLDSGAESLVVRTAWVCRPGGDNFVEKILAKASAGEALEVVDDQLGSPTLADDLAAAIFFLVREGHRGLFHVTNTGATTWYGLAREVLALTQIEATLGPITTESLALPADRPRDSRLALDKLEQTGWSMRPWQAAIAQYIANR